MENREVARVLRETAELIASLAESIEVLARDPEKLEELPGIGERMAEHIREILSTGDYALRKKLLKKYPLTMLEMLSVQSLGPKKALILWREFNCCTVDQLEQLAHEGKLRDLAGFGEKTEQNILKAIEVFKKISGRFVIPTAEHEAEKLITYIQRYGKPGKPIGSITPAGSLRRWKETIGDLDFLLTYAPETKPEELEAIKDHILGYGELEQVLARGENKVSFRVAKGLQVDVRLLRPENYGAALIYFTGSKEHNVSLRGRAIKMGYTLNEYALATLKDERRVAGTTEEEVYAKLKLDFIPPELRENWGEIEAAEQHTLPNLISQADLQGDVHMHTVETDGRNTIEEMAEAARAHGYAYMAITDHSKNLAFANGLDDQRAVEHIKRIRAANEKMDGIRIFAGIEVDILSDGTLDLSDSVLEQMDLVIASVHSHFNQSPSEMTDRLLKAVENPTTSFLGHPTGRLLLRRDAYQFDVDAVLKAAAQRKVAMELNAYPDRLDLCDRHLRLAKQYGVKIVINTDSHHTSHLDKIRYGVLQARRAWLTKEDVLNALSAQQFSKAMKHAW